MRSDSCPPVLPSLLQALYPRFRCRACGDRYPEAAQLSSHLAAHKADHAQWLHHQQQPQQQDGGDIVPQPAPTIQQLMAVHWGLPSVLLQQAAGVGPVRAMATADHMGFASISTSAASTEHRDANDHDPVHDGYSDGGVTAPASVSAPAPRLQRAWLQPSAPAWGNESP